MLWTLSLQLVLFFFFVCGFASIFESLRKKTQQQQTEKRGLRQRSRTSDGEMESLRQQWRVYQQINKSLFFSLMRRTFLCFFFSFNFFSQMFVLPILFANYWLPLYTQHTHWFVVSTLYNAHQPDIWIICVILFLLHHQLGGTQGSSLMVLID